MDFRAVLVLCLLISQMDCGPIENGPKKMALDDTIQDVQTELRAVRNQVVDINLHSNMQCPYLNTTELGEREQQTLTMQQLSSFRCYLMKASEPPNELTGGLKNISQYLSSMEELMGSSERLDCPQPTFKQDVDRYMFVSCLLQHLEQRLSNAKLN